MDKFTTRSTSPYSQKVIEPIIIEEGTVTRRVFVAQTNDKKLKSGETVSGTIVHQRKTKSDTWEEVESINLAGLKGGEGVKIKLRSAQLKRLYDGLTKLYALSTEGVSYGEQQYIVGKEDEILEVPQKRKGYIVRLLKKDLGEEIWNDLIDNNPDLATRLSLARIQTNREKILNEFNESLKSDDKDETYWQDFFSSNEWIFGYGLSYQFLSITMDQPSYGGSSYTGKGNQKGDYLTNTESAKSKFTVLVEIKRPDSLLLAIKLRTREHIRYRNGAWLLGSELLGGVSQLQVNCKTWQRSSEELQNRKLLEQGIYTVQPKGILVIGNTKQFEDNIEKLTSFELFRQGLSNIEVLTFDELYERAKFIVGNLVNKEKTNDSDDDFLSF